MSINLKRHKILLICSRETCFVGQALKSTSYEIMIARNKETGVQKTFEYMPDLIICHHENDGINGFHIYNQLKDVLEKYGILFFIYSDNMEKEDILIGLEMGVDNFILSPVDESSLFEKIMRHLQKYKYSRIDEAEYFRSSFKATPVAKFIIENDTIEQANNAFFSLIPLSGNDHIPVSLEEVFDMNTNSKIAMNYKRCLNGTIRHCSLVKVQSQLHINQYFDIHLQHIVEKSAVKLFAEMVPHKLHKFVVENHPLTGTNGPENKKNDPDGMINPIFTKLNLTPREKEILQLSAHGLPVKQIAVKLGLSERTIEKHRSNIMQKTGTSNIVEAIFKVLNYSVV